MEPCGIVGGHVAATSSGDTACERTLFCRVKAPKAAAIDQPLNRLIHRRISDRIKDACGKRRLFTPCFKIACSPSCATRGLAGLQGSAGVFVIEEADQKRRNEQCVDHFVYRGKHEGSVVNFIGWTRDPLM